MWTNFHNLFTANCGKKDVFKTISSPEICYLTISRNNCSTTQLYSTFSSYQSEAKTFNYNKCLHVWS